MRQPIDVIHDARRHVGTHQWSPSEASERTSMQRRHAIAYYLVALAIVSATGFVLGLLLLR